MKNTYIEKVSEFHQTFNAPILSSPQVPSDDRCELRISLLQEELNELAEAIEQNNIIEIADALADIQYVLSGAILEFGLGSIFDKLFNEVHRSNMSKACESLSEVELTQVHYAGKGVFSKVIESRGKYMVHRIPDDKILKSVNYSPANLVPIFHSYE